MNSDLSLTLGEKISKAVTLLNNENKVAHDYGIGFPLYHAEVNLLYIISKYPHENTSLLAIRLGITKGAITQITQKLLGKGLLTSFNTPGNRKVVYFELTKLGKKVISSHIRYHEQRNAQIREYFSTLSNNDQKTIHSFFDVLINSHSNE